MNHKKTGASTHPTNKKMHKNKGSGPYRGSQDCSNKQILKASGQVYGVHYHLLKVEELCRALGCSSLINQSQRAFRSLPLDELFRSEGQRQPLTHIFPKYTLPPSSTPLHTHTHTHKHTHTQS